MNPALQACLDYDHWAAEVARLTDAIVGCICPKEEPALLDGSPREVEASCFTMASLERVEIGPYPDDGVRRLYLAEIAKKVVDCPQCSRLCALIAERREARRKWGAAKRRIRAVARSARATEPEGTER